MPRAVSISRRNWLRGAALAVAGSLSGCTVLHASRPAPALPPGWRLVGSSNARPHLEVEGTPVGGLSGLDYDPSTGLFWALSDDRSQRAPARLYTFSLPVSGTGQGLGAPQFESLITLRQSNGSVYPGSRTTGGGAVPDPEALRLLPGTDTLVWTSEGDIRQGQPPTLTLARRDGQSLDELPLPSELVTLGKHLGPRNNQTLEGLALIPGTDRLWLGMENPLKQDGALCRLTHYSLGQRRALGQRAYRLGSEADDSPAFNGISDILAWGPHHLLVLERGFSLISGFDVQIYCVDTRTGSDTLGQPTLDPKQVTPVTKTLLVNLNAVAAQGQRGLTRLDNLEGMTWGPVLPSGERTLVLISDDNFLALQHTQVVMLALPPGDPA